MKVVKDFILMPMKIAGRFTIGSLGFLLMGGGLLLIDPVGLLVAGIPIFLMGLLLLVKALF
ncbi:MAG: hypothetical protein ACYTAF_08035 [Planctomycetota bacterium]